MVEIKGIGIFVIFADPGGTHWSPHTVALNPTK